MSKLKDYINEVFTPTMIFVDTTLHMGGNARSNIVVQVSKSTIKVLEIGVGYITNEEQAREAVDLSLSHNAKIVYVWKNLFSHHVVQWVKNYKVERNPDLIVDHIESEYVGSGYGSDIGYKEIESKINISDWKYIVNEYREVRANLYSIYRYLFSKSLFESLDEERVKLDGKINITGRIEKYISESNEIDTNKPFAVVSKGGSVGGRKGKKHKGDLISSTHDSLEGAKEKAKRMNKLLTKGERQYYKMKYSAVALNKKHITE